MASEMKRNKEVWGDRWYERSGSCYLHYVEKSSSKMTMQGRLEKMGHQVTKRRLQTVSWQRTQQHKGCEGGAGLFHPTSRGKEPLGLGPVIGVNLGYVDNLKPKDLLMARM